MEAGVRKLLAVSWAMPPLVFPRSIQVSRLLMALARRGWQIDVVCVEPQTVGADIVIDNELERMYAGSYLLHRVAPARSWLFKRRAPDPLNREWLKPAIGAINRILSRDSFSAFVTFAQPWVDHLIGLQVRERLRVPWVAHFSDPWADNLYFANLDASTLADWRKMEETVIRQADAVVFTNDHAANLVMGKYPAQWRKRVHVIAHGYDPDLLPTLAPGDAKNSRLHLVYTGNVYTGRNPSAFLQALENLAGRIRLQEILQVEFIGGGSFYQQEVVARGLERVVAFRGLAPYLESLQIAANADALLVIDAPSATPSPFLPSKLVDYMMLRKPILGLTPTGASADLLCQFGCSVVDPQDTVAIANALADMLAQWQAGTLTVSAQYLRAAEQYNIHHIAGVFDGLLNRIKAA